MRYTMQLKKNYKPELSQSTLQSVVRSAVVIISKDLFIYIREKCALYCMVSTFRP